MAKLLGNNINYVLYFYFLNILVVALNIFMYFRNKRLDAADCS